MNPYSRSPWADWFRFMKSMSISDQGSSRLNCVCRCASGFVSWVRPFTHIFAGEKVCIQVITPTHAGAALASRHICKIASGPVSVGFHTTRTGSLVVEIRRDLAGVLRDLVQRLLTVQLLTAGQEPDFLGACCAHWCTVLTRFSRPFLASAGDQAKISFVAHELPFNSLSTNEPSAR